jgi:hypothetical protein
MSTDKYLDMDTENADEMIRANGEAEAAEQERLRRDVSYYQEMLGEMKELYLKNNELISQMQGLCDKYRNNSGKTGTETTSPPTVHNNILEHTDAEDNKGVDAMSDNAENKENEENMIAAVSASQKALEELIHSSDEQIHKDNVRVYRNVQASMIEELEKQTKTLETSLYALREGQSSLEEQLNAAAAANESEKDKPEKGRNTGLGIFTFIIVFLVFVLQVSNAFGLTDMIMKMLGL